MEMRRLPLSCHPDEDKDEDEIDIASISVVEMDPPIFSERSSDDIVAIELRPLNSSDYPSSSQDAPEDDVILPSRHGSSSSRRWRAHSSSSMPLRQGITFVAQPRHHDRNDDNDNCHSHPVDSSNAMNRVVVQHQDGDTNNTQRKKMVLLLMMTFVVVLLSTIIEKRYASVVSDSSNQLAIEEKSKANNNGMFTHDNMVQNFTSPNNSHNHESIYLDGYQPTAMIYSSNYILPGTEDAPPLSAAKGRPYVPIVNHFQFRNPTSPYASVWGNFDFRDPNPRWDGKMRPQPQSYNNVLNRDIKNTDFPKEAWQSDEQYMREFLHHAKLLVNRTIEGIYAEYGVGIPPDGSIQLSDEQILHREIFAPFLLVKDASITPPGDVSWSTQSSFDGIARRIIHHIMTGDTFKLTLGGHSAAAGHGAGFNQSYVIEAGHVLEPVFAHLGVEFRAYNFAQGGMGTLQQAMAGMDLRGKETDWIIWDSSMTEKSSELVNFFYRQALISGNRSPVLMGDNHVNLNSFHEIAGAAIATSAGNGWVPVTENDEQVQSLPWAAQWLQCSRTATTDCKSHEYTAGCWVEREDFEPPIKQDALVGGATAWHPGNRIHKRRGRLIALVILRSLAYTLEKWEELGAKLGFPIPEEYWHVTEYYDSIRVKAKQVPGCFGNNWKIGQKRHLEYSKEETTTKFETDSRILDDVDFWPPRICDIPLQGRSLWGPRSNPMETSLLSIMKANVFGDIDPTPNNAYCTGPVYNPPDRPAPWTVPPEETEPFAPLIGASRRMNVVDQHRRQLRGGGGVTGDKLQLFSSRAMVRESIEDETAGLKLNKTVTNDPNGITPGLGIQVHWGAPGVCDGTSHHWCDKRADSSCLMVGSQDSRGMVCFDGLSGWVVFDVKNVQYGFIGARMEAWHGAEETPLTATWTEENNGGKGNYEQRGFVRQLQKEYQHQQMRKSMQRMREKIEEDVSLEDRPMHRRLGGGQSCGNPSDYTFEWAIDGVVTSWNKTEFCERYTRLNYNLDVVKFMDDENRVGDFEVAMRVTNVGRGMAMCISHLYWA